jgi:O-antigen/teichoic acid export membrane protein
MTAGPGTARRMRFPALPNPRTIVRSVATDSMRRNSAFLMTNTVLTSALGFIYWTIAARLYPPQDVGFFAALTAGITLLATFAGLGLPNTIIKAFSRESDPRGLLTTACLLSAGLGTALSLTYLALRGARVLDVGGAGALGQAQVPTGVLVALFTLCVAASSVGTVADCGYIAQRRTEWLVAKNAFGSLAKIAVLPLLTHGGIVGLFLSYVLATALAAVLSVAGQFTVLKLPGNARPGLAALRRYTGFTAGNYAGMVFGILPSSLVPLIVLARLGPRTEAACAVEFLLLGFLNVIPSATAQSLFAEAVKPGERPMARGLRALKDAYAVMLPAIAALAAGAGLLLRFFGPEYLHKGVGPLRLLFLSGAFTAVTYVVDALLNSFGYAGVYLAMNAINAALVLGGVWWLAGRGLAGVSMGWDIGQALSAVIGGAWIIALRRRVKRAPPRPTGANLADVPVTAAERTVEGFAA